MSFETILIKGNYFKIRLNKIAERGIDLFMLGPREGIKYFTFIPNDKAREFGEALIRLAEEDK